jgi:hypothetical protein
VSELEPEPQSENPPQEPTIQQSDPASLTPGSLAYRIRVATHAYRFFGLIHDANVAQLIDQPQDAEKASAWPLAYFNLYLQKIGVPNGTVTAMGRILDGMERAGLLLRAGWSPNLAGVPTQGQLYVAQGVRSAQTTGNLWLSEALGPELVIESYKAVTVQVSGGEGKPAGTGLVLDRSRILTNRHVVEGLVGHGVDGNNIEIIPSFRPPEAQWITRRSRIRARLDVDVAIIEAELGDNEAIPSLPGIAFRDPRWDDELRVFGYPFTLGFTEQPITVEPGHVVNPAVESPPMFGDPAHKLFLTSAVERPGNSGGPIVAQDGRVIGLVIAHNRGGSRASAGGASTLPDLETDSGRQPSSAESAPFYRGIPASEVVKAIELLGITDLAVQLENPI